MFFVVFSNFFSVFMLFFVESTMQTIKSHNIKPHSVDFTPKSSRHKTTAPPTIPCVRRRRPISPSDVV